MKRKRTIGKRNENLILFEKYRQLRQELVPPEIKIKKEESKPEKLPVPILIPSAETLSSFDTEYVTTLFKQVEGHYCFIPKYKTSSFSLMEPLFHLDRSHYTHQWLAGLGTSKYLDIIEDVAINAKRISQLGEGFLPLTLHFKDPPHWLTLVEQERQEKCCPLLHLRDLGNGYFALVNVNDMVRYALDHNPLSI